MLRLRSAQAPAGMTFEEGMTNAATGITLKKEIPGQARNDKKENRNNTAQIAVYFFFFTAGSSGSIASSKHTSKLLSAICSAETRNIGFAPS